MTLSLTVEEPLVAPLIVSPSDGASFGAEEPLAFQGTGTPGATIRIYDGEVLLGEVTVDAAGKWRLELPQPLSGGTHELSAAALDATGREAAASLPLTFSIVEPASPPTILLPEPAELLTSEAVWGTASPHALLLVYEGDTLLAEATADADGHWSFQLPDDLSAGQHTVRAVSVDLAGEPLAESEAATFEVLPLVLSAARPIILLPETGLVVAGEMIEGLAWAGADMMLYDADTLLGEATADADGYWTFLLPDDLSAGEHVLRAIVVDEDGAHLAESPSATFDMLELRLPVTGGS
jgi:hypothetical protein